MELPPLIQRIVGDATSYVTSMDRAQSSIERFMEAAGRGSASIADVTAGLQLATEEVKRQRAAWESLSSVDRNALGQAAKALRDETAAAKEATSSLVGLTAARRAAANPGFLSVDKSFPAAARAVVNPGFIKPGPPPGWNQLPPMVKAAPPIPTALPAPPTFLNRALGTAGATAGGQLGVGSIVSGMGGAAGVAALAAETAGLAAIAWVVVKAFEAIGTAISKVVENGVQMERTRVTFQVLVGDAERGRAVFEQMQNLSIVTPFSLSQLSSAGETLLSMGIKAENLVSTLKMLGNVVGGDAQRLQRLSYAYGEIVAEGRVSGFRMRQLANVGVGIEDFAKTMGVSPQHARELQHAMGGLPVSVLDKSFKELNAPGGRFAGRNEAALGTAGGSFERLVNSIDLLAGKIGDAFFGSSGLAKLVNNTADLVAALDPLAEVIGSTFGGAFKALMEPLGAFLRLNVEALKKLSETLGLDKKNVPGAGVAGAVGAVGAIDAIVRAAAGGKPGDIGRAILANAGGLLGLGAAAAGGNVARPIVAAGGKPGGKPGEPERPVDSDAVKHLRSEFFKVFGDVNKVFALPGTGRTPIEQFARQMDAVKEVFNTPFRKFDPKTELFQSYVIEKTQYEQKQAEGREFFTAREFQKLKSGTGVGQEAENLPAAAAYGSQEAMDTINRASVEQTAAIDQVAATLAVQLEIHRQQLEESKNINAQLGAIAKSLSPQQRQSIKDATGLDLDFMLN